MKPTIITVENAEPSGNIRWTDSLDNVINSKEFEELSDFDDESSDDTGTISSGGPSMNPTFPVERSHQDIWEAEDITRSLQLLPGYDEITILITAGELIEAQLHPNAQTTGILLAAWLGNYSLMRNLLSRKLNIEVSDRDGRTPLHLACCNGFDKLTELLLDTGFPAHKWDKERLATPLHCAASAGSLRCVELLVENGAHVNAGLQGKSALHYAVQSDAKECVRILLEHGACPNTPQVFTETPLHVAAALGSAECVRLLLDHGADVRSQWGPRKITALHLAAEDGNAECTLLLLNAGAHIDARNHRKQTPLHLASLAQSGETLELLLSRGADTNAVDSDGRTPLHGAIVKESRSCDCVRILLDGGAHVNQADNFGYTPLHIAALNEFSSCVYLLIGYGGDVTVRTNGGISALSFIIRRTPDVIPRYVAKFDAAIKLNDHEIGDVDCELKLDFRILVPTMDRGETELLLAFIEVGQKEILKHPLCETFLFLKWRIIRKFFILSLLYHAVFVLKFSIYITAVFLNDCTEICTPAPKWALQLGYCLLALNIILLIKEVFQIAHGLAGYSRHWENWLQWMIIVTVFLCVTPWTKDVGHAHWQHHVAAVGILLAWLELMMLVGRFPIFGLYVQMFTTVAVNFSKFLLAYFCVLIAFAFSFSILLRGYPAFKHDTWALLKVVVMMSGELEFDDMFYTDEYPIHYPITTHLIFLAFIVLVTVILTNLLVGLAVSDIQGLQQSAGLDRLSRQAELVARLESVLFSKLLRKLPTRLVLICHRSAMLLTSSGQWALYVRPNDPREKRIPRDLITSIYQLVAERKERPQSKKRKKNTIRKSNPNIAVNSNSYINISNSNLSEKINTNFPITRFSRIRTVSENIANNQNLFEINENIVDIKSQMMDLCQRMERYQAGLNNKMDEISKRVHSYE